MDKELSTGVSESLTNSFGFFHISYLCQHLTDLVEEREQNPSEWNVKNQLDLDKTISELLLIQPHLNLPITITEIINQELQKKIGGSTT